MAYQGKLIAFDHVVFSVANAKNSASYFVTRLGFEPFAFKEAAADSPWVSYAVRQDKIIFVFRSPTIAPDAIPDENIYGEWLTHNDFVKDIAFEVSNIDDLVEYAKQKGAEVLKDIFEKEDDNGIVRMAILKTFGDNTHTLVDRSRYNGPFLPGYQKMDPDPINNILPPAKLEFIDHIESDMVEGTNEDTALWYENVLRMHRFWCVDYETDWKPWSNISHRSVANDSTSVVLSMKESVNNAKDTDAKKFVAANGGSGVEHIGLYTDDMITTIRNLRARGADLIKWPPTYYQIIRERLKNSTVNVEESIDALEEQNILIDFDEKGYMLQTFTKHTQARPTVFIEILQRRNGHRGFGAGNYKTLVEAIEKLENQA